MRSKLSSVQKKPLKAHVLKLFVQRENNQPLRGIAVFGKPGSYVLLCSSIEEFMSCSPSVYSGFEEDSSVEIISILKNCWNDVVGMVVQSWAVDARTRRLCWTHE